MAGDWGRETETHVQYCKSCQEAAAAPLFVALFCSFLDFVYLLVGSFLNLGACGVPGMSSGTFSFLIFLQKGVSLSLTLLPFKDCCVSWLLFFFFFLSFFFDCCARGLEYTIEMPHTTSSWCCFCAATVSYERLDQSGGHFERDEKENPVLCPQVASPKLPPPFLLSCSKIDSSLMALTISTGQRCVVSLSI